MVRLMTTWKRRNDRFTSKFMAQALANAEALIEQLDESVTTGEGEGA